MNTDDKGRKPHSTDYFGEYRDFWWNQDFLELMASRIPLRQVKSVLDVGCGIGHWGQLLATILSDDTCVTGIDREADSIANATKRAENNGLGERYHYQVGDVTALPFDDNTFDLVTCQTVLIHLKDPKVALHEMLRVVKPGGILLAAEPNNFANWAVSSGLTERLSVDDVIDRLRFALIIERGKKALGFGYNSAGDLIPGYMAELGAEDIKVYISDKAVPFFAPYSNKEQQVNIQQLRDWVARGFIGGDRKELLNSFVAGGGSKHDFDRYFKLLIQDGEETIKAIDSGTYHSSGGVMTYLIAAQKPLNVSGI